MLIQINCPFTGETIPLEKVNDPMFANKILGDGIGIIPRENQVFSPVEGIVTMIYETKHAIGLKDNYGNEYLLHLGIDTVELEEKPFKVYVSVGDEVTCETKLVICDWKYIKKNGYDITSALINVNKKEVTEKKFGYKKKEDPIFKIKF